MGTPKEKGDLLEYAVHKIEETLIASYPSLAGTEATIERNRIFVVDGVRHEADLWVTVSPGTPYETCHLIECKNRAKPVGTDEIDKLANKRARVGAHKALLIARRFTDGAVKLAKRSHIELVRVSEDFWPPLDALQCTATTFYSRHAALTVRFFSPTALERTEPIQVGTPCSFPGGLTTIGAYIEPILHRHLANLVSRDPRTRLDGLHIGKTAFSCTFGPRELTIKGEDVAALVVESEYTIEACQGKLAVRFSVEGRGGFVRMEYPSGTFGLDRPIIEILTAAPPAKANNRPDAGL